MLDRSRLPIDCLGEPPIALVPLFHMSNWVAWRYVTKDGKRTKVPFNAYEPSRHAKPNDPSTWATSKAALEALHSGKADGIGFMLHGTQYAAIDLDNCLDGDTRAPWAAQLVNEAHQLGAYVETFGTASRNR